MLGPKATSLARQTGALAPRASSRFPICCSMTFLDPIALLLTLTKCQPKAKF